jgi:hypothetical protein
LESSLREIVYEALSWKYPTPKRSGGVVQVAECLLSKSEALKSSPRTHTHTPKKKKKKKRERERDNI